MSDPRPPRNSFTDILKVESAGDRRFSARLESFWGGSDPGDLLARAVLGSWGSRDRVPFSLQSSFFGSVPPEVEVDFRSEPLAPGADRISAGTADRPAFEAILRFSEPGRGLDFQTIRPEAGLPVPEKLPPEAEIAALEGWAPYAVGPIETRRVGTNDPVGAGEAFSWIGWLAPREPLKDSPGLRAAALAFLSAYRHHWSIERRLGADFMKTTITLLNHSLWVHRAPDWSDFLLVRTRSEIGVEGRCFGQREVFTRSGSLLASAAWEALARPAD